MKGFKTGGLTIILSSISFCLKGQEDDSDFVYSESYISKINLTEMLMKKVDYKYLNYKINATNYSIEYL